MKKVKLLIIALMALFLTSAAWVAADDDTGTVTVVHGVPGLTVDVYVNGGLTLPDFAPGTITDPLTLPAFTREATKQNWYPEWVIGGYQFTDTSTFARGFDQEQWSHAFGLSFLPPKAAPELNPAYQLYEWYHGSPPPADDSLLLTYPQVAMFFTGVHLAGPELTVEHFRDAAFAFPPTPKAVTQPSLDYGFGIWTDRGNEDEFPGDYHGIDDMVEIWWDAEAEGPDETGTEGKGLYRYVNDGRRYLPHEYTDEVEVFDPDKAVTEITDPPPSEVPPDYPPPSRG